MEAALRANPLVASLEPDRTITTTETYPDDVPNWAQLTSQWGLHNVEQTGGTLDADIDAPEAWEITTGSSDIVVAVLDTGIDYTHPDLVGKHLDESRGTQRHGRPNR